MNVHAGGATFVGRLSITLELLLRRLRSVAGVGGISVSMASALARLGSEGPLRVTELARVEGVSQPAMTQLVTRMEKDGLVLRHVPEDDRRGVLVEVTRRGLDVLEARRARRMTFLGELLSELSPDDQSAIAAALPALERLVGAATQQSRQQLDNQEEDSQR